MKNSRIKSRWTSIWHFGLLGLTCLTTFQVLAQNQIKDLRVWHAPDHSRVVFEISAPVAYQLFTLANPHRVVIDISNARVNRALSSDMEKSIILKEMRYATRDEANIRLVFDLLGEANAKSFLLPPNDKYGDRLVVDFFRAEKNNATSIIKTPNTITGRAVDFSKAEANKGAAKAKTHNAIADRKKLLVVIDPGHGGEDPGATGRNGVREKDVVLAMSRRLAEAINREPSMEAFLTRDGDYFLPLSKRMQIAREKQADFFISIHANSYKSPNVKGAGVYSISERGASSSAARALAEKENASDMLGGVTLADKSDLLASVLVDLSQSATVESSLRAARFFLAELGKITPLHKKEPQLAGFVVLKAPDVPALLIETAFISNPEEEKKLASKAFHDTLAKALVLGLKNYTHGEPGLVQRLGLGKTDLHIVEAGDSLSRLAQRYGVSLSQLRAANPKLSNYLRVGETLHIPVQVGG